MMQTSAIALTPTNMAHFAYCPRLFYIAKIFPQYNNAPTFPLVWGSFEHEAFRIMSECFDSAWRNNKTKSLKESSQADISQVLVHTNNLAIQSYPQFAADLQKNIPEFVYRINQWLDQKQVELTHLLHDGFSRDYAISTILPWKCEDKVFSNNLGLYGRIDAIYNDGRCLIPEDIKTHGSRFSTLLHQDSHKAQLLCYTTMLEEKYDMPSPKARILYSKDMSYVTIKSTATKKAELAINVNKARELLDGGIPPMLAEDQAIKCKHCYARDQCFKLAEQQKNENWIDVLTDPADIPNFNGEDNGN